MSKPSGAVHLVYDADKAAPLRRAIEHYEHYDHLLKMLSDELATVDPEKLAAGVGCQDCRALRRNWTLMRLPMPSRKRWNSAGS
jgi:hypothetical protein